MHTHLLRECFIATIDGKPVDLYTLKNTRGMEVKICNWGARVAQILVPDRNGQLDDVVFGYETLEATMAGLAEMGAVIGRYANRIANAQFDLEGQTYKLAANDGPHNLHSGFGGAMRSVFDATQPDERTLHLTYHFKDGEDGYPGNCTLKVCYSLSDDGALTMALDATTDKTTIVNFCNHAYFNLTGSSGGDILGHRLQLGAKAYTPIDETLIPTGEIVSVEGTPFDFTRPCTIGDRIDNDDEQLRFGRGYDHNFILDKSEGSFYTGTEAPPTGTSRLTPTFAARLFDPYTGRVMEVWTTEPGIQLYTGNFLRSDFIGKGGRPMYRRSALCLETQHFPDAIHHANFPSVVLKPCERYSSMTVYKFMTE